MIGFDTVKSQAENDFQTSATFIVFLYQFLPVLYMVVNDSNTKNCTWFTRSFLA